MPFSRRDVAGVTVGDVTMHRADTEPNADQAITSPICVVIATRNRRAEVLRHLDRHEAPIVLVDNASDDATADAVEAVAPTGTRIVRLRHNRAAVGRTVGVRVAGSPYVAFADDDSWWAPGALERAVELFEQHPRLGLIQGKILVGPEERVDPVCEVMANSPLPRPVDSPGPALLGFVACGAIVRTAAFVEAGGFDGVVRFPGEEERLALDLHAAGWTMAYVPDIVAHHHPSPNRDAPDARRAAIARSTVLTALMRRPAGDVARTAFAVARQGRAGWRGLRRALPDVSAALRSRRVAPPATLDAVRLLESDAG